MFSIESTFIYCKLVLCIGLIKSHSIFKYYFFKQRHKTAEANARFLFWRLWLILAYTKQNDLFNQVYTKAYSLLDLSEFSSYVQITWIFRSISRPCKKYVNEQVKMQLQSDCSPTLTEPSYKLFSMFYFPI